MMKISMIEVLVWITQWINTLAVRNQFLSTKLYYLLFLFNIKKYDNKLEKKTNEMF